MWSIFDRDRATFRIGTTLNRRAFSVISRVMKRAVIGVPS